MNLWRDVAKRVLRTAKDCEKGRLDKHPLLHLGTVYGVASVAYYGHDKPIMSDGAYDQLCKHLHEHFDRAIAEGAYGTILDRELLKAGSGFHLSDLATTPPSAQGVHHIYASLQRTLS